MEKRKLLKIELKSDLISGSGESFGNIIDTDITRDTYGFPYIPARRIRGLIREAYLELFEFGIIKSKDVIDDMFGNSNKEGHHFILHDAYLDKYESMKDEIKNLSKEYKKYVHPNQVINHYTVVRSQTAIENDTAKENSLRSLRAISRDNCFYAYMEIDEVDEELFNKAIKLVSHMGINRTRGFGEVVLSLEEYQPTKSNNKKKKIKWDFKKEYQLTLVLENISQLSISGLETDKTLDYIPGNSILGYFANQYLKTREVDDLFYDIFINGNTKFTNAYTTDDEHHQYYPVKESIFKQKVGNKYYDKCASDYKQPSEIISKVHDKFMSVGNDAYIKEVNKEMVYHHRRPDNKSYGRVISNDLMGGGIFYQNETMSANQKFICHIYGTGKCLNQIVKIIENKPSLQIGKSKNTQYGNVKILDKEVSEIKTTKLKQGTKVVCTFTSPVVLLNDLNESITTVDGIKNVLPMDICDTYINYTKVSGYNSVWKLPKVTYNAFSAGTCFVGTLTKDVDSMMFIGENNVAGLGQVIFEEISKQKDIHRYDSVALGNSKPNLVKDIVVDALYRDLYRELVEDIRHIHKRFNVGNTQVGRLLLILHNGTWDDFVSEIDDTANRDRKKINQDLVKDLIRVVDEAVNDCALKSYVDINMKKSLYKDAMNELLLRRKYEGRRQ